MDSMQNVFVHVRILSWWTEVSVKRGSIWLAPNSFRNALLHHCILLKCGLCRPFRHFVLPFNKMSPPPWRVVVLMPSWQRPISTFSKRNFPWKKKQEIWPRRPRYMAATMAMHRGEGVNIHGAQQVRGGKHLWWGKRTQRSHQAWTTVCSNTTSRLLQMQRSNQDTLMHQWCLLLPNCQTPDLSLQCQPIPVRDFCNRHAQKDACRFLREYAFYSETAAEDVVNFFEILMLLFPIKKVRIFAV